MTGKTGIFIVNNKPNQTVHKVEECKIEATKRGTTATATTTTTETMTKKIRGENKQMQNNPIA